MAPPDLIGRRQILEQIKPVLSDVSGASVVALYGCGDIGKIRFLNDTLQRGIPGGLLAKRSVDRSDMHSFLHDEMDAVLKRQISGTPDDAPESERVNKVIIKREKQSIDDLYASLEQSRRVARITLHLDNARIADVRQEIRRLLIDQMGDQLRLDPLKGFREYVRLTFSAIVTDTTMLDIRLQSEILVFLDERDPSGLRLFADNLERKVVRSVAAIRPVVRLYAENDDPDVIRAAHMQPAGGSTEAALDIWKALARRGRAESEAQRRPAGNLLVPTDHARGFGLRVRGQIRPAIDSYHRAAALWRRDDVPICMAWTLNNLGLVAGEEGNFADGAAPVEKGLAIRKNMGARALIGLRASPLARILILEGDYRSAATRAEHVLQLLGSRISPGTGIGATSSRRGAASSDQSRR